MIDHAVRCDATASTPSRPQRIEQSRATASWTYDSKTKLVCQPPQRVQAGSRVMFAEGASHAGRTVVRRSRLPTTRQRCFLTANKQNRCIPMNLMFLRIEGAAAVHIRTNTSIFLLCLKALMWRCLMHRYSPCPYSTNTQGAAVSPAESKRESTTNFSHGVFGNNHGERFEAESRSRPRGEVVGGERQK